MVEKGPLPLRQWNAPPGEFDGRPAFEFTDESQQTEPTPRGDEVQMSGQNCVGWEFNALGLGCKAEQIAHKAAMSRTGEQGFLSATADRNEIPGSGRGIVLQR